MSEKSKENMEKNWDSYYSRYLIGLGLEQIGYKPDEIAAYLGYADVGGWNRAKRRFEYSLDCADRKRKTPEEKDLLYQKGIGLKKQGMSNAEISKELGFLYPEGWYSFSYHYKNAMPGQAEQPIDEEKAEAVYTITEMSRIIYELFEQITGSLADAKEKLNDLSKETNQ